MTKADRETFKLPLNRPSEAVKDSNNFVSLGSSIDLKKSSSTEFSLTSDITMPESRSQACDKTIVSLNYSSGNSAMVLDTLIGAYDLQEARMRNKINKQKGVESSNQLKKAKAITAMYHFNEFGCKIGKTALQKKQELWQAQQEKLLKARKKEEAKHVALKRKYDDIMDLKLDDDKLSGNQLKVLLNFKKRKTDKGFSSLKKKELLQLWKEWKPRCDEPHEFENAMVYSVVGATVGATVDAEVLLYDDNEIDQESNINVELL